MNDFFVFTDGYVGYSYNRVYVCAPDSDTARLLAWEVFKRQRPGLPLEKVELVHRLWGGESGVIGPED